MKSPSKNRRVIELLRMAAAVLLCLLLVVAPSARGSAAASIAEVERGVAASAGTVVVSLSPSASSVAKGDVFSVNIQIVAGTQLVVGAEVHLFFSKSYLQVVDALGNPVTRIVSSGILDSQLANKVYTDTEPARIHFAAGTLDPDNQPSGTFTLATIYFKALWGTGGASTPLTFGTQIPFKTDVTYGVNSVLDRVENGTVVISGDTPPPTPTLTATLTPTQTPTPTETAIPTFTPLHSATPTRTPTRTLIPTITWTPVGQKTATPTLTAVPYCTPQTISFQNRVHPNSTYLGVQDTYLNADDPSASFDAAVRLQVKNDGAKRPLLRFDVSSIPPGSVVMDAQLWLLQDIDWWRHESNTSTVRLYKMTRAWLSPQASWYKATTAQFWGAEGADAESDRSLVAADTVTLGVIAAAQWRKWEIRDMVQDWVNDPGQNAGLILLGSGYPQEFHLASSEYPAADLGPKLDVRYCPAPPTPTPTQTPTSTATPTATPTPTETPIPGHLEGRVWNDLNGNGVLNEGESGLAGATIYLYSLPDTSSPARPPVTTADDGVFVFTALPPGWYNVQRTNPAGYVSTTDDSVNVLIPTGGTVWATFGAWIPATATPTITSTPVASPTPTATPSPTRTATPSPTRTPTATLTVPPTRWYWLYIPVIHRGWPLP